MRLLRWALALAGLCAGLAGHAQEAALPGPAPAEGHWRAQCTLPEGAPFEVVFDSASGVELEDDMSVRLRREGRADVTVPLPPAGYGPRTTLANVHNHCDRIVAVAAGPQRLLLLLSRDNRPGWNWCDAVLVDTRSLAVLDVKHGVGEIKEGPDNLFVLRQEGPGRYGVRLIEEYLQNAGCDCAAMSIEGWRRIEVVGRRLRVRKGL